MSIRLNILRLIRTLQYAHTNPLNFEQSPLSGLAVTASEVYPASQNASQNYGLSVCPHVMGKIDKR